MSFQKYPATAKETEGEAVLFDPNHAAELREAGWIDDVATDFGVDDVIGVIVDSTGATMVHKGDWIVRLGDKRQKMTTAEVDGVYELGDPSDDTEHEPDPELEEAAQPVNFAAWGPSDNSSTPRYPLPIEPYAVEAKEDPNEGVDGHAALHDEVPVEVKPGEGSDFNPGSGITVPSFGDGGGNPEAAATTPDNIVKGVEPEDLESEMLDESDRETEPLADPKEEPQTEEQATTEEVPEDQATEGTTDV